MTTKSVKQRIRNMNGAPPTTNTYMTKMTSGQSRHRKSKGKRLQNQIAEMVGELTGLEVGKDCPIESRRMGEPGPDIRLDTEARKRFPFTVETKNTENWSLPSAIRQCQSNLYPKTDWLVVLGKNRTKPVVVLDAEVFFQILRRIKK